MTRLTSDEVTLYESQKYKEKLCYDKNKKIEYALYQKFRDHCHYTGKFRAAAHSICNLRYKIPKKIPMVFYDDSTYDYHFIIKQLAEDFKGQFECLGENTEKYITFSVPTKDDDNGRKITYKLKSIEIYRFMSSKLSDLVDNVSEINKNECLERKVKNVNLLDLKMIDYITDAKNVKKDIVSQKMG